ncbi:hypothetical protein DFH06DRAFT_1024124, partial [Mycena polygramma]
TGSETRRGMSEGYAMSEMATLQREYLTESDEHMSTFEGVKWIIAKKELQPNDIWDQGVMKKSPHLPRFSLEPKLFRRIDRITAELQVFLKSASALVEGRTSFFAVDPEDACLPILQGAHELAQLQACWNILRKRVMLGDRNFSKYQLEYQTGNPQVSPASTAPELYEPLKTQTDLNERLRLMHRNIPHHLEDLSQEQATRLDYMYEWQSIIPANQRVVDAFPK